MVGTTLNKKGKKIKKIKKQIKLKKKTKENKMQVSLPIDVITHICRYQSELFFFPKQKKIVHVTALNKVLQDKYTCIQNIKNNQLRIDLPIKKKRKKKRKCYTLIYKFLYNVYYFRSYVYKAYIYIEDEMYVSYHFNDWNKTWARWDMVCDNSHIFQYTRFLDVETS
jgi:hypothetical protein